MNFRHLNIKTRLTLLFVFIFVAVLLIFSGLLYREWVLEHQKEFDITLYNYAVDISESLDVDRFGDVAFDSDIIDINDKILPFSMGESYISILTIDGSLLAQSVNAKPEFFRAINEWEISQVMRDGAWYINRKIGGQSYRYINFLMPLQKSDRPLILQIAVPQRVVSNVIEHLWKFFASMFAVVIVLSFGLGYFLADRALRPMNDIIAKTKKIEATNLSERISIPETKDELNLLATTINGLLEKLEKAFLAQERFVADASHQLKTPLALIKAELDMVKDHVQDPQVIRKFVKSTSEEVETLIKLTKDLLLLARVDAGNEKLNWRSGRIDELVLDQMARLGQFAKTKNIQLNFVPLYDEKIDADESLLNFKMDEDLIKVVVYNLIENAIKYSRQQSEIVLELKVSEHDFKLQVKDSGPGINLEEKDKIFQRFYREEIKSAYIQGAGLGLAICSKVATLHGAKLDVQNREDQIGAIFSFELRRL